MLLLLSQYSRVQCEEYSVMKTGYFRVAFLKLWVRITKQRRWENQHDKLGEEAQ